MAQPGNLSLKSAVDPVRRHNLEVGFESTHARAVRGPGKKLSWVLKLLLSYLAAITIFGKGPTYIGIEPLFWGEIVLGVSVLWAVRKCNRWTVPTSSSRVLTLLICCFIALGAAETIRDYGTWGLDCLRDSAIWYYALFYFVGLAVASNGSQFVRFCSWWKLFFVLSIPWAAEEVLTGYGLSSLTPVIGGHAAILGSALMEIVQSMGLGCVLLLSEDRVASRWGRPLRIALATLGSAATAIYYGRGAKLAVLSALMVYIVMSVSRKSGGKSFHRNAILVALLLLGGAVVETTAGGNLVEKLSLDRFSGASLDHPDDTAGWRSLWWDRLYTEVAAQNPVLGLGFGLNLADYNPLIGEQGENPVRSPHNFNVTILARMGFAGLLIWVGILFLGIAVPFWGLLLASSTAENEEVRNRLFWIATLTAIWVNSSFSVLMEGPVMGIPFWLILGLLSGRPIFEIAPALRLFLERDCFLRSRLFATSAEACAGVEAIAKLVHSLGFRRCRGTSEGDRFGKLGSF